MSEMCTSVPACVLGVPGMPERPAHKKTHTQKKPKSAPKQGFGQQTSLFPAPRPRAKSGPGSAREKKKQPRPGLRAPPCVYAEPCPPESLVDGSKIGAAKICLYHDSMFRMFKGRQTLQTEITNDTIGQSKGEVGQFWPDRVPNAPNFLPQLPSLCRQRGSERARSRECRPQLCAKPRLQRLAARHPSASSLPATGVFSRRLTRSLSAESAAALAGGGRSAHLAEKHPMIAAEPGRALSASALRPLAATFLTVAGTPGQPLR